MSWSRRRFLGACLGPALAGAHATAAGPPRTDRSRLSLRVRDEFGPLRSAIVHDGHNAIDVAEHEIRAATEAEILEEHPETRAISRNRVIEQQARLCELLDRQGVRLSHPQEIPGAYCQVFARDPAFVVGDTLFLGALRDHWRIREVDGLQAIRNRSARDVELEDHGVLIEGGDVIVLEGGSTVLVGTNRHTNEAGHRALAHHLEPMGVEVVCLPHRALHLDCVLAPMPDGQAMYVPGRLSAASREQIEKRFARLHEVDPREAGLQLAANVLWLDPETVVSNADATRTNRFLEAQGYRVLVLPYSEMVAMWGSFRCAVCPLVRA